MTETPAFSDVDSSCPLSVVILTKNEESNIKRCVEAVRWCSDVVVVDDSSTDRTVALAEAAGARVVTHRFVSFAEQRNWAMQAAGLRNPWVLHLDADEVVTGEARDEIERILENPAEQTAAYCLCRKTMLMDRWLKYSDGFPVWIMRLVRRGRAEFRNQGHGEVAVPPVDGRTEFLRSPILHFAFSKGLANWVDRHNRYSTLEATLELEQTLHVSWRSLFTTDRAKRRAALRTLSRRLPCRPMLRFLFQFIWKRGFLDGKAGLQFCRLMAMYEGLIVAKRKELRHKSPDIDASGTPAEGH